MQQSHTIKLNILFTEKQQKNNQPKNLLLKRAAIRTLFSFNSSLSQTLTILCWFQSPAKNGDEEDNRN